MLFIYLNDLQDNDNTSKPNDNIKIYGAIGASLGFVLILVLIAILVSKNQNYDDQTSKPANGEYEAKVT